MSEHAHFEQLMNEMREHHKQNANQAYILSDSTHYTAMLMENASAFDEASLPPEFDQVKKDTKASLVSATDTQKTAAQKAATDLKSSKDQSSFVKEMEAQKAKAKADNDKIIDAAYDKAIAMGKKNPAMQGAISHGMNFVMGTITKVTQEIVSFVMKIAQKVMDFINDLIKLPMEFISKGFDAIKSLIPF